jgi:hypothetical protein
VLSRQDREADEDVEKIGSLIWNYYNLNGVQSNLGGAKNITCTFCDASFTTCFSTRAFADILGSDVLGQKIQNIGTCERKL